jgi:hypothetical protein
VGLRLPVPGAGPWRDRLLREQVRGRSCGIWGRQGPVPCGMRRLAALLVS